MKQFSMKTPPVSYTNRKPCPNSSNWLSQCCNNFVFCIRNKFWKVWNNMRISKWWQNFHFWMHCPNRIVQVVNECTQHVIMFNKQQINWIHMLSINIQALLIACRANDMKEVVADFWWLMMLRFPTKPTLLTNFRSLFSWLLELVWHHLLSWF